MFMTLLLDWLIISSESYNWLKQLFTVVVMDAIAVIFLVLAPRQRWNGSITDSWGGVIARPELGPTLTMLHLISWLSGAHRNTNARERARVHAHNFKVLTLSLFLVSLVLLVLPLNPI